jgi:hypothetical protein
MNCAWSSGNKSNTEGVMRFHGDTLDGTPTSRYSSPNFPTKEYSSLIKGVISAHATPSKSSVSSLTLQP